ncbi:unnamed protein product [Calicophoron daubneyi]|uniref:EF-hand domain-containing protein n=1 Tax=Calicophoron daubneyi TaxID=300641 RepID=A0AAV2TNY0_CALDB
MGIDRSDCNREFFKASHHEDRMDAAQCREALAGLGIIVSEEECGELVRKNSAKGDGKINLSEFCIIVEQRVGYKI